jgi:hypothetical protein
MRQMDFCSRKIVRFCVRQSILYACCCLHRVKKPKGKDLIDTWTCRCVCVCERERERERGERFTKNVALFLFLLFASSSLKFVVM